MTFNLYFAGSQHSEVEKYIQQRKASRLFTFASSTKKLDKYMEESPQSKIFLDSGAYSKYHLGVDINLDKLIEYINERPQIEVFGQLDDIPYPNLTATTARQSGEGNWEKYIYMMDRVVDSQRDKVLPVFHFGEPYCMLERMLETEVHGRLAPYIAFGGRAGVPTKALYAYLDNVFEIVKKSSNPNVKIHAFGITVLPLLERYPFYSADSTTWLQAGVNGGIYTNVAGMVSVSNRLKGDKTSYWFKPLDLQNKIRDEVESFGYNLEDLTENYRSRLKFNVDYFLRWTETYEHKPHKHMKRRKLF